MGVGTINRSPTRAAALLATTSLVLEKPFELANAGLFPGHGSGSWVFDGRVRFRVCFVGFLTIEEWKKEKRGRRFSRTVFGLSMKKTSDGHVLI